MTIYIMNSILTLEFGLFLCAYRPTKPKTIVFLAVSFLQMFLISLFRLNIGFDYQMYVEGFYRMAMDGFSNMTYLDWEYGFVFFTKIVAFFTKNHVIYLGIISFFCFGSTALFIYKNSKMVWLSTILYGNLYFFYLNMNFLRQSIAIAITLFAWKYLKNRKFLPFLGIILIASTFHSTALILIPVYFFVKIKPNILLILLYCYGLLFFWISSEGFINLLTSFFHQEYQNSILLQGLSFVYMLLPIAVLISAWVFKDVLLQSEPHNQYLIHFVYFTAFFMIIMSRHAILERLSYYSYIYFILFIPELIMALPKFNFHKNNKKIEQIVQKKSVELRRNRRTVFISTAVVLVVTYAFSLYGMLEGVHGVFPYKTWLLGMFE